MREYLEVWIDLVDEQPNNARTIFEPEPLEELTASICLHGMLEPIVVRRVGDRYVVIAGDRRLRAARAAGWTTVPVLVEEKDATAAELAGVAENLHRVPLTPLEEAHTYQRLLSSTSPTYTIDDLEVQFGRKKRDIHQLLMLLRLTPEIQELLAGNILPLSYALKLATVPRDRQPVALDICFRPLFRDEGYRRDQLEPLARLTDWLRDNVRRDPHGHDTQMLLPDLAAQVTATEMERHRTILKVSQLTFHTDRSDPDVILSKSWKRADTPEERCKYARPAIVVLGPNQDTVLDVCIAKKQCEKHWPPPNTAASGTANAGSPDEDGEAPDTPGSPREPAEWQKREQERRRWLEELRPQALRLFAERTTRLAWSWPMLRQLLSELDITDGDEGIEASELADVVGALDKLPTTRYPQVLSVAFAIQRSGSRETLLEYARQFGVSIDEADLTINIRPVDAVAAEQPASRSRRRKKPANAA